MSDLLEVFKPGEEFATMDLDVRECGGGNETQARIWRVDADGIPVDVSAKKTEDK